MLFNLLVGLLYFASGTLACDCTQHASEDNSVSTDAYMKLNLHGKHAQVPIQNRHIDVPIYKDEPGMSYFVHVSIGSDNQVVSLQLDTGSPITWVNSDCSKAPDEPIGTKAVCFARPRYNSSVSSTAKMQDRSLNVTYYIGSVQGTYFRDNIRIGSLVAKDALFGVATASDRRGSGILGIGAKSMGDPPTIVDTLAAQGQIPSRVYSVDLGSNNETGTLIPGGVDTKKYKTLTKISTSRLLANLTDISMTLPNTTTIAFPPSL